MRPGSASGGSNLGYGVAARHPVTHLNKILIIVAVQHFTAVVGFDNNSITETALGPALHHPSVSDRVNRGPGRRCDVGSGMITEFAVDRIVAPTLRGADNALHQADLPMDY